MKIEFERSGGFAGLSMTASVDSDTLSAQDSADLRALVDAAHFFDLPARLSVPSSGADRFMYKITVTDGNRSHTVEASDAAIPETMRPLIQRLSNQARAR